MIKLTIQMRAGILSTKLFVPPNRSNWVVRPRLLQKLNDGLSAGSKLGLVAAPAGFGKTTLVTGWISALRSSGSDVKTAWLSLDSGDNDLTVFLNYLIASVQSCAPEVGVVTSHLLDATPLPTQEALLQPLINDLSRLSGQVILVLDDYHVIQVPAIHEALAFLIERQPPNMQILITTRQDPFLPLARWRAHGMLTEIRLKELRFSETETTEFLNQMVGFNIKNTDIVALEQRTEGWIAGLQLAAISLLQSGQEPGDHWVSGFVQSFAGNDRFVMDYLMDEVLLRQPEPIQQFLLQTSILERFNASLCQAVLAGKEDEAESSVLAGNSPDSILEYLDRANLFLIPLDYTRSWYRYHHLFSELLQHRLKIAGGKTLIEQLKLRASQWFDQNGFPEEAVRYAQSAEDWDLSSRLLEKHIPVFIRRGEIAAAVRWLAAMPDEALIKSAVLCCYYGYVLTTTAKLDQGWRFLQLAEQALAGDPANLGSTLAFASYNACFRGDFSGEIQLARRALTLIPAEDAWMRGVASISLGLALCHSDDPQGCENAMLEAFAAGQQSNTTRTCVHALTYLGRISILRLDFRQAEVYFQQAIDFKVDGQTYPGIDISLFDLAQLKYEQNDLDQAMVLVERGFKANQRSGGVEMLAYGYRLAARLNQMRGNKDSAHEFLQKAQQLAIDHLLSPLTLSLNAACRVEMALTEGNMQEARLAAPAIINSLGLYTFNFFPEMARVHLLLALGRKKEAMSLLETALPRTKQPGWEFPRLQARVLQTLGEDDPEKARQHLREALALAEGAGAVRCFIDLGVPMKSLLLELRPLLKSTESAFADQLLSVFNAEMPAGRDPARQIQAGQPVNLLVEPLTGREVEVLRLLADGLSNAEIAQRLYLSPNTLKAHTQNIYSKMDVHSRVQVVNKARELGIIP